MTEARFLITSPEFDEVSVVDKGDNPPARIVLWKHAPEEELLTDEEIEKVIGETEVEVELEKAGRKISAARMARLNQAVESGEMTLAELKRIIAEQEGDEEETSQISDVGKEANKVMTEITKRSDAKARFEQLTEEIAKNNPDLTPAEAFVKVMDTEEGSALRARYNELPIEERAPVSKGRFIEEAEAAENRETHPAVVELRAKAQEIRKDAVSAGEKISEAEAFARAMEKHPEFKAAYYQER